MENIPNGKSIFRKATSKKCIALYVVILIFIAATIESSSWRNGRRMVLSWVNKGLKISFERQLTPLETQTECSQFPFVLVIVHSKPENNQLRDAIRNTWGNLDFLSPRRVQVNFLLGASNMGVSIEIMKEVEYYQDLIIEDLLENEDNSLLKSILMLRHLWKHNGDIKGYVIKTDDNVYLNLANVYDYLPLKAKKLVLGEIRSAKIAEDPHNCVMNNFCLGVNYTEYLTGSTYVMSSDVIDALYTSSMKTFGPTKGNSEISNKYITGILRKTANLTLVTHPMFNFISNVTHPCIIKMMAVSHNMNKQQIIQLHNDLVSLKQSYCQGILIFNTNGVYFRSEEFSPRDDFGPSIRTRNQMF